MGHIDHLHNKEKYVGIYPFITNNTKFYLYKPKVTDVTFTFLHCYSQGLQLFKSTPSFSPCVISIQLLMGGVWNVESCLDKYRANM